jgi:hypothetical protein
MNKHRTSYVEETSLCAVWDMQPTEEAMTDNRPKFNKASGL